jgi:hypothetical protein
MQKNLNKVYYFYNVLKGKKGVLTMVKANSLEKGLQDGWTRATFILRKDYLSKLKAVSYWERKKMKEVIDEALGSYLKGKKIKPISNGRM